MNANTRTQALEALKTAKRVMGTGMPGSPYANAHAKLDAAIAALESAAPSIPRDFITHKTPWRQALEIARDRAEVSPPDVDDRAYWEHELRAFDRAHAELAAAPSAAEPVATQAARDVLAERQRQISTEGYTPEHDDEHGAEEFGRAASVYANSHVYDVIGASYMGWPWDEAWYKPTTQRRNFVKAAALLLAGIECIDRAAGIATPPAPQAASEPVAGLSGDAEREAQNALEAIAAEFVPGADRKTYRDPTMVLDFIRVTANKALAALHSTGKPDGEVASEPVVPFLARDVAELLGISVPELSAALMAHGMPARSQGMTIGPLEALAVRRTIAATADAPVAEPVGRVTSFGDLGCTVDYVSPQKYRPPVGAPLYTRPPATEAAKDAALRNAADELETAAFHIDGTKPEDVATNVIESTSAAHTAILAARHARAALSQGAGS